MKARDSALREVVLTDVCPYTLGTQVSRMGPDGKERTGYFHPIIQRNSVVPVSREDVFHPVHAEQKVLRFDVYQGESPTVDRNIKLGELQIPLTNHGNEDRSVTTRFTYDVDGILQVEVTENATGKRHELVLEQNPGVLAPDQIQQRLQALQALKVHPRDHQPNIALIARTERLYSEHVDQREQLQGWLLQFREALESQDSQRVERHRRELGRALDELEGLQ
jgi:molecular chaperone HscC